MYCWYCLATGFYCNQRIWCDWVWWLCKKRRD